MLSYVTADFTRLKSNNRTFLLLRLQKNSPLSVTNSGFRYEY